jgi:hypothetical protein
VGGGGESGAGRRCAAALPSKEAVEIWDGKGRQRRENIEHTGSGWAGSREAGRSRAGASAAPSCVPRHDQGLAAARRQLQPPVGGGLGCVLLLLRAGLLHVLGCWAACCCASGAACSPGKRPFSRRRLTAGMRASTSGSAASCGAEGRQTRRMSTRGLTAEVFWGAAEAACSLRKPRQAALRMPFGSQWRCQQACWRAGTGDAQLGVKHSGGRLRLRPQVKDPWIKMKNEKEAHPEEAQAGGNAGAQRIQQLRLCGAAGGKQARRQQVTRAGRRGQSHARHKHEGIVGGALGTAADAGGKPPLLPSAPQTAALMRVPRRHPRPPDSCSCSICSCSSASKSCTHSQGSVMRTTACIARGAPPASARLHAGSGGGAARAAARSPSPTRHEAARQARPQMMMGSATDDDGKRGRMMLMGGPHLGLHALHALRAPLLVLLQHPRKLGKQRGELRQGPGRDRERGRAVWAGRRRGGDRGGGWHRKSASGDSASNTRRWPSESPAASKGAWKQEQPEHVAHLVQGEHLGAIHDVHDVVGCGGRKARRGQRGARKASARSAAGNRGSRLDGHAAGRTRHAARGSAQQRPHRPPKG